MKPVLEIINITKKFNINVQHQPYLNLRESIATVFRNCKKTNQDFFALNDVSFNVQEGESIGIIGKNGAGKSTLLKVLSKITPPTSGRIISRGRIASLLEVGTGFHPELTGRENIYLNGSILGMKRKEINSKFDEIVAFSGVNKFLDTALKHYSSGMQLRLAFAVAAFLEPEILIIDEVLAVGDAEFQRKCQLKMQDVNKSGRTILFVSHNFNQINQLCTKCIYLREGRVFMEGPTQDVIAEYNSTSILSTESEVKVRTILPDGKTWEFEKDLIFEVIWPKNKYSPGWECDLACYTSDRIKVFAIQSQLVNGFDSNNAESNGIRFHIKNNGLSERNYFFDVGIRRARNEAYDIVLENCCHIYASGLGLPSYKRDDTILVPQIKIETSHVHA